MKGKIIKYLNSYLVEYIGDLDHLSIPKQYMAEFMDDINKDYKKILAKDIKKKKERNNLQREKTLKNLNDRDLEKIEKQNQEINRAIAESELEEQTKDETIEFNLKYRERD